MLTFIRYIEVYFTAAFLECVRSNPKIWGTHLNRREVVMEDFVKSRFVISRFCSIRWPD